MGFYDMGWAHSLPKAGGERLARGLRKALELIGLA